MILRVALVNGDVFDASDTDNEPVLDYTEDGAIGFVDGTPAEGCLFAVAEAAVQQRVKDIEAWTRVHDEVHERGFPAIAFLLENNHVRCLEDAIDMVDQVIIREGTVEDYAREWLEESALQYPAMLSSYQDKEKRSLTEFLDDLLRHVDYESYARDLEADGGVCEFTFNGTTYCCVNVGDL